jgi:hypothetical protein
MTEDNRSLTPVRTPFRASAPIPVLADVAASWKPPLQIYGTRFYRIEMLALLNDMIIVDRYLWE